MVRYYRTEAVEPVETWASGVCGRGRSLDLVGLCGFCGAGSCLELLVGPLAVLSLLVLGPLGSVLPLFLAFLLSLLAD